MKTGRSAAMTAAMAQSLCRGAKIGQPVERALQDEDRGVLVDHFGAPGAADIHADQLALDRRGRQPLVPERDWQRGELGEVPRKGAGRLRARALAAVHVDGKAEHEADRLALGRDREQAGPRPA